MPHKDGITDSVLRNTSGALEAVKRGYQPVPLVSGDKKARIAGWPKLRWENTEEGLAEVTRRFDAWADEGHGGLGVLLGEPSGGLVDIDLDHPKANRLKDHFLPRTPARSGRDSRPGTHYWYIAAPGTLQDSRTFKLPPTESAGDQMIVEYRSTGGQTALPGNVHPSGEKYHWSGEAWGGEQGPTVVDGRMLLVQTALLGLCTLLVNYWPAQGSRHQAYLALAGGLLRVGEGVHPYWQRNIGVVISAIADAANDEDGADTRYHEAVETTLTRLREGKPAAGFGKLAEIIGEPAVKQARVILAEIESAAGLPSRASGSLSVEKITAAVEGRDERSSDSKSQAPASHGERRERYGMEATENDLDDFSDLGLDPLEARMGSWEAVDLDPYLTGQVQSIEPSVMEREDGQAILYPGRLNMLYGPSEAAKSWLSLYTCIQMIERGERVVYIDLEDEPVNTLERLRLMGASPDDLRNGFRYVRPEEPLAPMQRNRWGGEAHTEAGKYNNSLFQKLLEETDPALIVADGMTVLYGLHGLDSNDSVQTDTITRWLKDLTRNGRTTVLVVDHTAKNPSRGSMPIGSQHKVSMVQGTLLQTYPVRQPTMGSTGEVELIVLKDRPGKVRKIAEKSGDKAQLVARMLMDSTVEGRTEITLQVPSGKATTDPNDAQELNLQHSRAAEKALQIEAENQRVLDLYEGEVGLSLSKRDMFLKLYGIADPKQLTREQRNPVTRAIQRLMADGWITRIGTSSDTAYVLAVAVDM